MKFLVIITRRYPDRALNDDQPSCVATPTVVGEPSAIAAATDGNKSTMIYCHAHNTTT